MQKLLIQLALTLLEKLGGWLLKKIDEWLKERKIKREQADKERRVENATTPDDIRNAHRSNQL